MLGFLIETQIGSPAYGNYLSKDSNQKELLRAERTWRDVFVAPGKGTIIAGNDTAIDYLMPDMLAEVTKYGNLVISERYSHKMLDNDMILSTKSIDFPLFEEEYQNKAFFEEVDDLEKKGEKKLVRKYELDLDDYTPFTVEEWTLFWSGINKIAARTPFQFKAIVKEPMILNNLGGIKNSKSKELVIINDNVNNSWELAFLLGYQTTAFESVDLETRRAKDLLLKSYLSPFAKEIYSGAK